MSTYNTKDKVLIRKLVRISSQREPNDPFLAKQDYDDEYWVNNLEKSSLRKSQARFVCSLLGTIGDRDWFTAFGGEIIEPDELREKICNRCIHYLTCMLAGFDYEMIANQKDFKPPYWTPVGPVV